ncbi:DsbA family oxidoreductase [bacterium]|nr:DsbA family oxidoreductase [bacterium]
MKIVYWSDYACPYCYIGEVRLKKALAELPGAGNVQLEMKAFQLDSNAGQHAAETTAVRFAQKYALTLTEAERRIEAISRLGQREGLDFKYASTLFTNTLDAHRLTKLAQSQKDPELAEKVIDALFKAYFTDNKELADKELLQKLGESCGLKADEVRELLASDKYKDEVIRDEQEAARSGIHGVPLFVIGRYAVSGAQSTDDLKNVIARVLAEETPEAPKAGISCSSDGCRIK